MANRRFMWRATLGRAAFKRLTGRGRTVDAGGGGSRKFLMWHFGFFVLSFERNLL